MDGGRTVPKSGPHAAVDHVRVDVDQVNAVASFYRHASSVVAAAASGMESRPFGRWSVGEAYALMAQRYGAMGEHLVGRLRAQAAAVADLADILTQGASRLDDADSAGASTIRRADGRDAATAASPQRTARATGSPS